jgi:transposase
MEETVTLNAKEQKRLMVLNRVGEGRIGAGAAAGVLGLSVRQTRRLLAGYRKEGAAALAHGNRGRSPHNKLDNDLRARVAELAGSTYAKLNTQHLSEMLAEREGLRLSRSTVRRILLQSGMSSPRKRRAPRHRSRRDRYPQQGMLLQIDGSHHDWLEGRGPELSLVGAIDDATGEVPHALFRLEEDTQGYFFLLERIVATHGIPLAIYRDRHSIFETPLRHHESLEEQLAGQREPTQFGRLLGELGITSIPSNSPQGRGRIERLWGTFQDRLVSELRLAGAQNIAQANQVVADFLPCYNNRFMVPATQPGSAYRPTPPGFIPEEVFCLKYQRTVGSDNVVRFKGRRLQIQPGITRPSYARARVTVHEGFDGTLAVYYKKGQCLSTTEAPPDSGQLRSNRPTSDFRVKRLLHSHGHKPGPHHPWRRSYKTFYDKG